MGTEYGVEAHEVEAVLGPLVGERSGGEPDESWYAHLSSRQALLEAAAARLATQRAELVAHMHADGSQSYATLAVALGLSRARVQQLVERGRDVVR